MTQGMVRLLAVLLVCGSVQATTATAQTVEIVRGSTTAPAKSKPAPPERQIYAGDRVWFVDNEKGRLIGCRLVSTINVGEEAIQCASRRLIRRR